MSGYLGINPLKRCSPGFKGLEFDPLDNITNIKDVINLMIK